MIVKLSPSPLQYLEELYADARLTWDASDGELARLLEHDGHDPSSPWSYRVISHHSTRRYEQTTRHPF